MAENKDGLAEFFDSGLDRFVAEHPEQPLHIAAENFVVAQILSPIQALGLKRRLSPGDFRGIRNYLELAKVAISARVNQELACNPFLEIDQRLVKVTHDVPEDLLLQIELTRKYLRLEFDDIVSTKEKVGLGNPNLVDEVCSKYGRRMFVGEDEQMEGYFYCTLFSGRLVKLVVGADILGIPNLAEQIMVSNSPLYNLTTNIEGVIAQVPWFEESTKPPFIDFGITFSRERIGGILSSRPLPELSKG